MPDNPNISSGIAYLSILFHNFYLFLFLLAYNVEKAILNLANLLLH